MQPLGLPLPPYHRGVDLLIRFLVSQTDVKECILCASNWFYIYTGNISIVFQDSKYFFHNSSVQKSNFSWIRSNVQNKIDSITPRTEDIAE